MTTSVCVPQVCPSDSVHVDLQYDEISPTLTAGLVWCLSSCGSPQSVCEGVVVPYVVGVVVVVAVMHVLLLVLHVCMLQG